LDETLAGRGVPASRLVREAIDTTAHGTAARTATGHRSAARGPADRLPTVRAAAHGRHRHDAPAESLKVIAMTGGSG